MDLTRRELAALVIGAAALPAAADDEAKKDEKKKPTPSETAAEALFRIVEARHGRHLSAAQLKQVRAGIAAGLQTAQAVRGVELPADDEPAFVFQADLP